ncbi:MAG: TraC family protein, partial [Propionibacteriaceae bacterium]|nr:TraC family protein [Propionibacteriaceae bacterium]
MEYNPTSRTFLLEDGISVGALFELTPAGTEARTPEFMTQLRDAIQTALTDAIPEEDDSPWILQVYVQDEPSLQSFQKEVADYAQPNARDTTYTRHFQQTMSDHLAQITRPGGLFEDTAVTGTRWRGQIRRVRFTGQMREHVHHQCRVRQARQEDVELADRLAGAALRGGLARQ